MHVSSHVQVSIMYDINKMSGHGENVSSETKKGSLGNFFTETTCVTTTRTAQPREEVGTMQEKLGTFIKVVSRQAQ